MKINVDSSQELSFDWSIVIEYVMLCVLSRFHKLQQEEEEVIRKRAANSTALAAIGPRKKRKLDEALEGSSTSAAVSKTSLFTIKDVQQILLLINSHFFKTSFANFTKHQRQHLLVDDFFFFRSPWWSESRLKVTCLAEMLEKIPARGRRKAPTENYIQLICGVFKNVFLEN